MGSIVQGPQGGRAPEASEQWVPLFRGASKTISQWECTGKWVEERGHWLGLGTPLPSAGSLGKLIFYFQVASFRHKGHFIKGGFEMAAFGDTLPLEFFHKEGKADYPPDKLNIDVLKRYVLEEGPHLENDDVCANSLHF